MIWKILFSQIVPDGEEEGIARMWSRSSPTRATPSPSLGRGAAAEEEFYLLDDVHTTLRLPVIILKVDEEDAGEEVCDFINTHTRVHPGNEEISSKPYLSWAHLAIT